MDEAQDSTDEELVRRFYEGESGALKVIFQRYKEGLFNFALRFSGNRADAEDAVSHAFTMVCEKKYTAQPGAAFKTWLFAVARNHCLTKLRGKTRFFSLWMSKNDSDDPNPMDIQDSRPIPREELSQNELAALIQKAVHQLPQQQKEALLLREYHKFSYEEISQVLNCSLENVKVLIFRARMRLKDLLPPAAVEEGR